VTGKERMRAGEGTAWIGSAGVVIWNGVVPEATEIFERWHDEEHIDERLSIPGFVRARRALAVDGSGEYLTLYEVAHAAALTAGAYPARLNAPTDWTRRVLPLFRGAARSLCRVAARFGDGGADHLVAVRLPEDGPPLPETLEALAAAGARLVATKRLLGFALLLRDDDLTARRTAEHDLRRERLAAPSGLVIGEAEDAGRAGAAARTFCTILGGAQGVRGSTVYRVQARRMAGSQGA
jgi:hypothetical protein